MKKRSVMCFATALLTIYLVIIGCSSGNSMPESQRLVGQGRMNMRSANTYMRNQVLDSALERYKDVIQENPKNIEALKSVGDIYFFFAEQERAKAREYYRESYDYYQRAIEAYTEIKHEGDFPNLKKEIDDAELKIKGCWARLFNMGQELFTAERLPEALKDFYKLAEIAPDSTRTYIMIASIHQAKGAAEKAAEYFRVIASRDSEDTISRTNLAIYYFTNQQYEEALKWYDSLIEINPENSDNYYSKGIVYSGMEEYENAMMAFEKAYQLDNENIDALINAANLAFNLQKSDKAVHLYKDAIEMEPESSELYMYLLYALNQQENYQDMLEYGQKWYELDKNNVDAVNFIILGAVRTGNTELQRKFTGILSELQ